MKSISQTIGIILAGLALTMMLGASTARAQGTAFLYQGREVNTLGQPFTGTANFQFNLYHRQTLPTITDTLVGTITSNAVPVANGLFSLELDFGPVAFDGSDCWLEVLDVTGAPATIITFPKQHIVSVPYATTAGAISANTFAGTSVTAQPGLSYLATNTLQVTVNLPATAKLGDVVQVYGLGAGGYQVVPGIGQSINGSFAWSPQTAFDVGMGYGNWQSVASSSDGAKLIAVLGNSDDAIFASVDSGVHWTQQISAPATNPWQSVASSSDGTKLVAAQFGGAIYTSLNGGATWIAQPSAGSGLWKAVASSADGTKLVAVQYGAAIYTSTDSGGTWAPQPMTGPGNWQSVASSADGTKLVAVQSGGNIYTSTDSGATWTLQTSAGSGFWYAVASSADGTKLAAVQFGGGIYTSSDSGATWLHGSASAGNWLSVASSSDGTKLVAAQNPGQIYLSPDGGATWIAQASAGSGNWQSVAMSADGTKLVAVQAGGEIYTSGSAAVPLVGVQGSSVSLRYAGNGIWVPISQTANGQPTLTAGENSAAVTFDNPGNTFVGNGGGLTGVSAATLNGLTGANFWQTGGNSGTTPAMNFLGTLDDVALEMHVNNSRALRLEPGDASTLIGDGVPTGAPNIIGGSLANTVQSGVVGATIGGGGANYYGGAGSFNNVVGADFGTVSGGMSNNAAGPYATVAGGATNVASGPFSFAAGQNAVAQDQGSFVWADSQPSPFTSIGADTFNVRARGGVNFSTYNPDSLLYAGLLVDGAQVVTVNNGSTPYNISISGLAAQATTALGLAPNQAVTSINTLKNDVQLVPGANISITPTVNANALIIASTQTGWSLNGNTGTMPGANFIGTIDNQPLEFHVNSTRALMLNPGNSDASAPNVVGGSPNNTASGVNGATIAGGGNSGHPNSVTADFGTVAGGYGNTAGGGSSDTLATVAGGQQNTASGPVSSVVGGYGNIASGAGSFVGGGGYDGSFYGESIGNSASAAAATICGGIGNSVNADFATISGGYKNSITAVFVSGRGEIGGLYSVIGGGQNNIASGNSATIGGGSFNGASGESSTVPGGYGNSALGEGSFAAGENAQALNNFTFVWGDGSADHGTTSFTDHQFMARASGGVVFLTSTANSPTSYGIGSAGAALLPNTTSWTTVCDRNAKKNFAPVNGEMVLAKLAAIPIEKWNYKWEKDSDVPNIGPMAQDFKAAFYPGRDDKGISTLEFDGVELAAIQGLNQKLEEKDAKIAELETRLEKLEQLLTSKSEGAK